MQKVTVVVQDGTMFGTFDNVEYRNTNAAARNYQAVELLGNYQVRANWSAKKNSLAAFFAAHKKFANKVVIVNEAEPHVINLLDEVNA